MNTNVQNGMSLAETHTPDLNAAMWATSILAASDGVIVTDPQGRIEFMNAVAEHLIGVRSASGAGRDLQELLRLEESDGRTISDNLVELAIVSGAPLSLGKNLVLTPKAAPPGKWRAK